jgi:urease accessory protein UreF
MMGIGAFLFVILIAFLFSSGVETPMKDGEVLSASGARWVETGIRTFYFLTAIAIGAMVFSSVKKLIKK